MKKFIFLFLLISATASAQLKVTTGDADLDNSLIALNKDAKNALEAFKNDAIEKFNTTKAVVENLLNIHKMEPSDVLMTLEVAQITTKPVETVATSFDKNKSKGWGEIAKEMGIKPGSKEFHALKNNAKGKSNGMKGKGKGNSSDDKGNGNGKGKGKGKK
ncbi:MAG: hypothetical protein JNK50_15725 [Bacteroidia bacterium]|nr:hypothetical protein [Bacteroidia bacterium]